MGAKSLSFRLTISLCVWHAAFTCMAATVTWNGGGGAGNANWSVGGNWDTGVPPGSADTARFAATYGNGTTLELDVDATLDHLRFEHGANEVTLASTATKELALTRTGSGTVCLYRTGTADLTIGANLAFPNTANWAIDIRGSGTVRLDGEVNVTNAEAPRYGYIYANNSTASVIWNGAWSGTLGTGATRFHVYGNPTGTITINADNSAFNCGDFRQFGGTLILNHPNAMGTTRVSTEQFITGRDADASTTLLGGEFTFDYNTAIYERGHVTLGTNIASGTAKWGTASTGILLLERNQTDVVWSTIFAALNSGATLQVDALVADYTVGQYNQGKRPVKIAGEGTVVFTRANTYAAGTTVGSGTLLVDNTSGSGTGTGPVTVEHGATLGGTGTIAGTTTVKGGGTLAPAGAGVGTLVFGSDLTLENGALWNWQLDSSGYDKVLGPKLILPDTPGSAIALNIAGDASGLSPGDSFVLFDGAVYQGSTPLGAGQFLTDDLFTIHDTSGWWGTWEVMPGSLTLTAVPEPGAWLLLLSALACGLPVRRRRAA